MHRRGREQSTPRLGGVTVLGVALSGAGAWEGHCMIWQEWRSGGGRGYFTQVKNLHSRCSLGKTGACILEMKEEVLKCYNGLDRYF